jgi:hypothetical protein
MLETNLLVMVGWCLSAFAVFHEGSHAELKRRGQMTASNWSFPQVLIKKTEAITFLFRGKRSNNTGDIAQ